ncbi:unnamed protein product [Urochloa decumbens]|uniref:F-box domain-containing protein n=1 Tax=Urochloa decumbens TaxID=240449 RepID=A0ABC8WAS4_9POAL
MGKDSRRRAKKESRRRRRIASACARENSVPPPTRILDVLPDDLIELILLRVRTTICLFRAAATCKPLRRVVAGDGFLHRFRAIHSPRLLLGHYCISNAKGMDDKTAVFVPSPPRPGNNLWQRLSLDFLPGPSPYSYTHERVLIDSRGGLLAFLQGNWDAVVCDPWTRQYKKLHFPWGGHDDCCYYFMGAFLLDASVDDDGGNGSPMSNFMLLCAYLVVDYYYDRVEVHACVFSARQDRWLEPPAGMDVGYGYYWTCDSGWSLRAGGSVFWFNHEGYMLAVDENSGEFSKFRLSAAPDDGLDYFRAYHLYDKHNIRVVGGGAESAVRIVCVADGNLEVLTRVHGASECTVERRVGLCQFAKIEDKPDQSWRFVDTDTTLAALLELGAFSPSSTFYFSLGVETMKLQRLDDRTTNLSAARVFPYEIPWPQTISACL